MTNTTTLTPIYDQVTQDLGFSLEELGLPPVRPVTKRQRHKARTAALRAQAALIGPEVKP